jgi:hypothetical protein
MEGSCISKPRCRPAKFVCQVPSCGADLTHLRMYHQRCRICEEHHRARVIEIDGHMARFCHQCAALQRIEDFKGNQRSCVAALKRHKDRRRQVRSCAAREHQQQCPGQAAPDSAQRQSHAWVGFMCCACTGLVFLSSPSQPISAHHGVLA